MNKNALLFVGALCVGALVTLAVRTARHDPYASPVADMVEAAPSPDAKTVNTVCPICGMDVDPSIAPAEYQGKLVGFGCKNCPPKFAAEPDVYGPSALENKVVE